MSDRREFLKKAIMGGALVAAAPTTLSAVGKEPLPHYSRSGGVEPKPTSDGLVDTKALDRAIFNHTQIFEVLGVCRTEDWRSMEKVCVDVQIPKFINNGTFLQHKASGEYAEHELTKLAARHIERQVMRVMQWHSYRTGMYDVHEWLRLVEDMHEWDRETAGLYVIVPPERANDCFRGRVKYREIPDSINPLPPTAFRCTGYITVHETQIPVYGNPVATDENVIRLSGEPRIMVGATTRPLISFTMPDEHFAETVHTVVEANVNGMKIVLGIRYRISANHYAESPKMIWQPKLYSKPHAGIEPPLEPYIRAKES
jgi:hypothetical protein